MGRKWTAAGVRLPAEIHAQTTIMMSYLIKPIRDQLSRMFRER
jgi:hypothetical protein